ncbi:1,2-phenylacetyl-CoA epoxidase subunit PaaC [Flavitalea flava]
MAHQQDLIDYTLHLADDSLILGHRNSEWTGYGPVLEQDIAISNIALDLIGQARNFYQYAAKLINPTATEGTRVGEVSEDSLAYLRDSWDFKNSLLVEQTNGDWARTILRQFFFSGYQYYFYERLCLSTDSELAAISEKALKETTYHLRWSSEWVIRLGDGTDESHRRISEALEDLWKFTGELFAPAPYEKRLAMEGIGTDLTTLKPKWEERVKDVFGQAGMTVPADTWMQTGGKEGKHTEKLGYILVEMQFLQRAYPGCEW